jgi:hypothetical protein
MRQAGLIMHVISSRIARPYYETKQISFTSNEHLHLRCETVVTFHHDHKWTQCFTQLKISESFLLLAPQ